VLPFCPRTARNRNASEKKVILVPHRLAGLCSTSVVVLMLGLQLTFWEHATSFTGESIDLLLFATIVWQMLEYRLDEKKWRLTTVALIYGAGITESWMFTCFFLVLLAALIWLKKLEFFNLRFLVRMTLFGMGGLLFFFVLPLAAKFGSQFKFGFWK